MKNGRSSTYDALRSRLARRGYRMFKVPANAPTGTRPRLGSLAPRGHNVALYEIVEVDHDAPPLPGRGPHVMTLTDVAKFVDGLTTA